MLWVSTHGVGTQPQVLNLTATLLIGATLCILAATVRVYRAQGEHEALMVRQLWADRDNADLVEKVKTRDRLLRRAHAHMAEGIKATLVERIKALSEEMNMDREVKLKAAVERLEEVRAAMRLLSIGTFGYSAAVQRESDALREVLRLRQP